MPHNMTVTIEDELWKKMKKHHEMRWSAVMRDAAEKKLKALAILERVVAENTLSEKDIRDFSVALGKKITGRK